MANFLYKGCKTSSCFGCRLLRYTDPTSSATWRSQYSSDNHRSSMINWLGSCNSERTMENLSRGRKQVKQHTCENPPSNWAPVQMNSQHRLYNYPCLVLWSKIHDSYTSFISCLLFFLWSIHIYFQFHVNFQSLTAVTS